MSKGYDEIYRSLLPILAKCNIRENAPHLGGQITEAGVEMTFLARKYLITNQGVEPMDNLPVDVNSRSILIYYITSQGAGSLSYEFAPLNRLTGLIEGQNTLAGGIMNRPLVREFGSDYERFRLSATRIGGIEQPTAGTGKHVWQIPALPKILAQIVFYEADDEYPADIQIMFDRTAPRFLEFECLAFLTGAMVNALIRSGQ